MESNATFTQSDEGKSVVNRNGEPIGRIVDIDDGRGYVDPDPSVTDAILSKLGWGTRDDGSYQLDPDDVEEITDDEVALNTL